MPALRDRSAGRESPASRRGALAGLPLALLATTTLSAGCITWARGVEPVSPSYKERINEQPITLEWKPAPIEDGEVVRYELAVFDRREVPIHHVADLAEPRAILPEVLSPGSYRWTVRAHFWRGGQWRPGPWNRRKYLVIAIVYFQWGETIYQFRVADRPS